MFSLTADFAIVTFRGIFFPGFGVDPVMITKGAAATAARVTAIRTGGFRFSRPRALSAFHRSCDGRYSPALPAPASPPPVDNRLHEGAVIPAAFGRQNGFILARIAAVPNRRRRRLLPGHQGHRAGLLDTESRHDRHLVDGDVPADMRRCRAREPVQLSAACLINTLRTLFGS